MLRNKFFYFTALLILVFSLSGCTNVAPVEEEVEKTGKEENTEKSKNEDKKTLVVAYDRDAETLDHIKTSDYHNALGSIFDKLVSRDNNMHYHPGLASKWDISEDGLKWTFYLKENIKFHDGTNLTAHDVKWTYDTIKDPETASPAQSEFEPISEVVVEDDYTLHILLDESFPNLLFRLSSTAAGIASEKAYEEHGSEYGSKYVIGSGPYKLKEWKKGDKIVLEKNEEYKWGPEWKENNGLPVLDEIVMKIIPEENIRMMELEAGSVHIVRDLTPVMMSSLGENSDIEIHTGGAPRLGYLAYATDKEPFNDLRVRQAINHAINKEEIIDYVFRGLAEIAHGYLPPILDEEYFKDSEKVGYEYDVEKAKALLAEAGYGEGLKLKLAAENASNYGRLAEVLQSQLKEVGIETEIQLYESSSYSAMLKAGEQDLFLRMYGWQNADILDWFLSSSQFPFPNHSRWQDEKTDKLLWEAERVPTWNKRIELYHELQEYLIEQAVWAPIYIPSNSIAVRKEVLNFKYSPISVDFDDGIDLE